MDENLPRKLVEALRAEGQQVESVHTLRMQGLDNGALYRMTCAKFDLCFTRDAGFVHNAGQGPAPAGFRLLRVILPQTPQEQFVPAFITAFRMTEWSKMTHCGNWP